MGTDRSTYRLADRSCMGDILCLWRRPERSCHNHSLEGIIQFNAYQQYAFFISGIQFPWDLQRHMGSILHLFSSFWSCHQFIGPQRVSMEDAAGKGSPYCILWKYPHGNRCGNCRWMQSWARHYRHVNRVRCQSCGDHLDRPRQLDDGLLQVYERVTRLLCSVPKPSVRSIAPLSSQLFRFQMNYMVILSTWKEDAQREKLLV